MLLNGNNSEVVEERTRLWAKPPERTGRKEHGGEKESYKSSQAESQCTLTYSFIPCCACTSRVWHLENAPI